MKKSKIYIFKIVFIALIACLSLNAHAIKVKESNRQVKIFSNSEGFFQNTVMDICSDQSGDLWFATVNGLIRYDGYKFYTYTTTEDSNSIQSNMTRALFSDKKGRLWIGSSDGLCIYDTNTEDFTRIVDNTNVTAITESPDSCIWVITEKRIDNYDPEKISQIKRSISLADYSDVDINLINIISDQQCLVATNHQIMMVDIISDTDVKISNLEPIDFDLPSIATIKVDGNFLWIGTNTNLIQCTIDRGKLILIRNFQMNEVLGVNESVKVKSILIDSEDKIWIGTRNEGIVEFDRPSNTFYTYPHSNNKGLSSPTINCFYEDEFKSIWIGTAQGGVNQIDKTEKPFFSYTNEPYNKSSLSGHLVNCILEDNKGYIWTSFSNFAISRSTTPLNTYNNLEFEKVSDKNNTLKNKDIMYMYQDNKGWIWFCDATTMYLYDEKNDLFRPLSINYKGHPANLMRIRKILPIDDETLLLLGNGVAIIKNPWSYVQTKKPIEAVDIQFFEQNNYAEDVTVDDNGNYWVATTTYGLKSFKLNSGNILFTDFTKHYQENDKALLSSPMLCVHYSNVGLWLGTFGKGLIKVNFNNEGQISHLNHLNENKGLSDDMVYGILEDEENNLWCSTDMGLNKFNTDTKTFDVFNINDGMLHNNFRRYAYLKTKSNTFIFGGLNGLTFFKPKDIEKKQLPPDVKISQIRINNKKIRPNTLIKGKNPLVKDGSIATKLTLYPSDNSLHIEIITKHSATPLKNKVAYRLDGVDNEWVLIDEGKTTVNYTSLRPGNYIFRYKGANGDGLWTEKEKILNIKVLSPWYLRWWSILLEISLLAAIIIGIMNYYLQMQKLQNNLIFEQNDKMRIKQIDEAKLRLFTNISHEFKTPLSLIMAPLEKLIENNKNEKNNHYILIIQSNIKRLLRLIEQLVEYRKHDQGKLKIQYSKIKLGDFVCPLIESFEEIMASRNITFIHKLEQLDKEIVIDTEKTEMILFNILSNAVKYTKRDGLVELRISFDNKEAGLLTFAVNDNGIGILPEDLSKIFDRFYRTEQGGSKSGGFGIGLSFSKSLVDGLNGSIDVSSEPNVSTTFEVTLPYQNTPDEFIAIGQEEIQLKQLTNTPEDPEIIQRDSTASTLLIIDDEPDFRNFLYHTFKENYNVILVESGEEAFEKLQLISPQLIICDVMMEGMNGFEVCEKVKLDTDTCHIPVILLTALSAEENELKSVELGADFYIQKPFSIHFLEVKVKQIIADRKILQEHYSKRSYLPDEKLGIPKRELKFLEKINEVIENNIDDLDFGITELASVMGYSISHFSRRLKQLTGQVPNLYVRNYRLQRAAEMLTADKSINTKEVMYSVGITSSSYFSSAFKKVYGVAPSVYRDTIQDKNEEGDDT